VQLERRRGKGKWNTGWCRQRPLPLDGSANGQTNNQLKTKYKNTNKRNESNNNNK
jgi:hypothetical protein